MAAEKDTIYIDIDDEITGIIDKVRNSDGKVLALVLPKRASVFQSIVNMKLLKRAADDAKKRLVLITTEAGLLPLAGAAGVHVAKTLNSKPELPVGPGLVDDKEETIQEDTGEELDSMAPVGVLAGLPPAVDDVETLELDNEEPSNSAVGDTAAAGAAAAAPKTFQPPTGKKPKKDNKFKIPDFNRFRILLAAGILALILLIVFIVFALTVWPKASISIKTNATNVSADLDFQLSTQAQEPDIETKIIPAKLASEQKTFTQQIATTGQKNKGNKASGEVTIINCGDDTATISAGTGFSSNGNTYISQEAVSVPGSNFNSSGKCKNDGKASVNVLAQNPGSSYNLPSGSNFSIAGGSSRLSASGGNISGGTDNIVQVVNQADINNAKAKISSNDGEAKKKLQSDLKSDNYFAIVASFSAGTPSTTNSANVGETATSVTVTETITYTMFGAKEQDLKDLVDDQIKSQIDTSKQSILDEGLNDAAFTVNNVSSTGAQVSLQTVATAGPDLDTDAILKSSLGKKPSEVKSALQANSDVTDVDVKLSPFWVSSVPKKESKVTINIAKPSQSAKASKSVQSP